MYRFQNILWALTAALGIAVALTAIFGGGIEVALAHGTIHAALGAAQPAADPIPFWG